VRGGGRTSPIRRPVAKTRTICATPMVPTTRPHSKTPPERRGNYSGRAPRWQLTTRHQALSELACHETVFRCALTCSVSGGGTDAVQSASLIGPSLSSGFQVGMVVPAPGKSECHPAGHVQHATYHIIISTKIPVPCSKGPLRARDCRLQQPVVRLDASLHAVTTRHGHPWSENPRITYPNLGEEHVRHG
jgi:hypothetical protein